MIALTHRLLVITYNILRTGEVYRELGADYFERLHPNRVKRYLVKRLERLCFEVRLVPAVPICLERGSQPGFWFLTPVQRRSRSYAFMRSSKD